MANIREIAERAKAASLALRSLPGEKRAAALNCMAEKLLEVKDELLLANAEDIASAGDLPEAFVHRLRITEKVFKYMLNRLREAAALPDPVGRVLQGRTMPSGLQVKKIAIPIGVVAMIYEARPNVTTDAAAVAIKSGNAVILRGGSESIRSNKVLASAMRSAAVEHGLPEDTVQLIESTSHEDVNELLGMTGLIDLVIPRGGKSLIKAVSENSKIPVLKHYDGICHQYIAEDADLEMSKNLILNSKCQRVEVCNALETLLIDAKAVSRVLPGVAETLIQNGVELRGCPECMKLYPELFKAAEESDWDTEYLAPILSIKIVSGIEEAVNHISLHGSGHTDGIITNSLVYAQYFIDNVDSASVLVNASTRLSGGGDYGMGAVVGISTDKLHARGPVGPEELCSTKWVAIGNGTLRN